MYLNYLNTHFFHSFIFFRLSAIRSSWQTQTSLSPAIWATLGEPQSIPWPAEEHNTSRVSWVSHPISKEEPRQLVEQTHFTPFVSVILIFQSLPRAWDNRCGQERRSKGKSRVCPFGPALSSPQQIGTALHHC